MDKDTTKINTDKISTHPIQTKAWGEFRQKWGNEVLYTKYGLLTLHALPLINKKIAMFIKCPKPTREMLLDLKKIGQEKNLVFIKLEPNAQKNKKEIALLKNQGAVPGKTLFTPTTFVVDLTKKEQELMNSFNSKTRYNIRLAQKKGVTVKVDNSDKAFESYLKLLKETVERQGFYAHSMSYHQLMWETMKKQGIANLLIAKYKNKILTAWILFNWKDTLYYPYGASSTKHKEVMANNLMMWEAIKFGKRLNAKTFDLWGREEGKGFTRFKEGFNPKVVEFLGTWDLIIDKNLYPPYRILENLRWLLLRTKAKFVKPTF